MATIPQPTLVIVSAVEKRAKEHIGQIVGNFEVGGVVNMKRL